MVLERLRKICLALPGVQEKPVFEHPAFRVGDKMFCIYHGTKDDPSIAMKVSKMEQSMFLEDPRFFKTPYIGQHGYISLPAAGKLDWEEIEELIKGSHALVSAPKAKAKTKKK